MSTTGQSFQLTDGTRFTVQITINTVRKLRDALGLDLNAIFERPILQDLAEDPVRLADALWIAVEDEARRANITDEQFGRGLAGDSLGQATAAFLRAVCFFFPPTKQAVLLRALEKLERLQELDAKHQTERLEDPAIFQAMEQAQTRAAEAMRRQLQKLSEGPTTPPDGSGSTPAT